MIDHKFEKYYKLFLSIRVKMNKIISEYPEAKKKINEHKVFVFGLLMKRKYRAFEKTIKQMMDA